MTAKPRTVALLVESETVPAWVARAVGEMVTSTGIDVTHVVVNEKEDTRGLRHYLNRAREYPLWTPVGATHLLADDPPYQHGRDLDDVPGVADAERIHCVPEPAPDFGNVIPDAVVDAVAPQVDLAVRFGFGILKGRMLTEPEYGVLSYHHGDLRRYRGQPAGFWEFVNGESTAGVTLQRINETLDGGEIVAFAPVDIADAHTWQEVSERLFAASDDLLAQGVQNLRDPDFETETPERLGDLYSLPKGTAVPRYVVKNNVGRLRTLLE